MEVKHYEKSEEEPWHNKALESINLRTQWLGHIEENKNHSE